MVGIEPKWQPADLAQRPRAVVLGSRRSPDGSGGDAGSGWLELFNPARAVPSPSPSGRALLRLRCNRGWQALLRSGSGRRKYARTAERDRQLVCGIATLISRT